MGSIAVVNNAGIYGPATPIPAGTLEVDVSASAYTTAGPADFFSASPPVTALGTITNVFSGSRKVPASFFGMDFSKFPSAPVLSPAIPSCNIIRSHDNASGLGWASIELSAGVYTWTKLDAFVSAASGAGKSIIYTIEITPNFYSARPAENGAYGPGTAAEPSDLTKWDAFCAALATRYKGVIGYYEILNEPNGLSGLGYPFFSGTQTMAAQMVRRANQQIKAVDSSAKILCPPCSGVQTGGAGLTYFTGMMAASDGASGTMASWVDVVACHTYPSASTSIVDCVSMASSMRTAMTTAGVSGLPLWSTECSTGSSGFAALPAASRITAIQQMMTSMAAANAGGFDVMIWYATDGAAYGWTPADIAVYEQHRLDLMAGVTVLNKVFDGRVAAVVNGKQFLWSPLTS